MDNTNGEITLLKSCCIWLQLRYSLLTSPTTRRYATWVTNFFPLDTLVTKVFSFLLFSFFVLLYFYIFFSFLFFCFCFFFVATIYAITIYSMNTVSIILYTVHTHAGNQLRSTYVPVNSSNNIRWRYVSMSA